MANVGVTFNFAAESARLRAHIDRVRKEMMSLKATAQSVEKGFRLVGGAIVGAFSISAVTGWLRTVNQAADRLNDQSAQLGTSATGLQALQVAAVQAGGSAEGLNTALWLPKAPAPPSRRARSPPRRKAPPPGPAARCR